MDTSLSNGIFQLLSSIYAAKFNYQYEENTCEELVRDYIRLSIRLWGILTTHEFDMGNPG